MKEKTDKLGFSKIKTLCPYEYTLKRMTQATVWEEIFLSHISDKGLVFRIYKELQNLTVRKQSIQFLFLFIFF